jgi:hypothetical protein
LIAGPLSDKFGIQTWFLLGGMICVLMAVAGFFIPALKNIETERQDDGDTASLDAPEFSLAD